MIRIKWTERGATPRGMKRTLPKIKKRSFFEIGVWWHKAMRPKHFTRAGAREYNYAPRRGERGNTAGTSFKSSYTGQKLRRMGHTLPLVFTGESRGLTRVRDVRATSKGARVVMRANRLNLKPKRRRGTPIDLRDEMTRVSVRERRQLVRLFDRTMDRKLNADRTTRTVKLA